jgi:hypothetical protein
MPKSRKDNSGLGATEPIRGLEAQKALESLIGMPLNSGYGKCLLSLGVDAADALLALLCKLGVSRDDIKPVRAIEVTKDDFDAAIKEAKRTKRDNLTAFLLEFPKKGGE